MGWHASVPMCEESLEHSPDAIQKGHVLSGTWPLFLPEIQPPFSSNSRSSFGPMPLVFLNLWIMHRDVELS